MASSPHRVSLPLSSDEGSPFSLLKGQVGEDQGFILRTRSLDEANHDANMDRDMGDDDQEVGEYSYSHGAALNSSFDSSLQYARGYSSFHENVDTAFGCSHQGTPMAKSTVKHSASSGALENNPFQTVRKARRDDMRRPTRPPATVKKAAVSTPNSALKRRRAPLPQRQSPMRRIQSTTPLQNTISSPMAHYHGNNNVFAIPHSTSLLGTATSTPTAPPKSTSKWYNTGTTATTVLESTMESNSSVDTSSPTTTRFKFTSFPDSLPRVNNPRVSECPDSVRKRMPFTDPISETNQSRDDEGTQNTSISSLSGEGQQHLLPTSSFLPPSILRLDSQSAEKDDSARPLHARLFADDEQFGYSDDETTKSPARDAVCRTRLNFNTAASPNVEDPKSNNKGTTLMPLDLNMELSRPYDQRRINSFPSSLSSSTNANNLSGCDEQDQTGIMTPTRSRDPGLPPATPNMVQVHFPLEAEFSPIPGVREDPDTCSMDDPTEGPDDMGPVNREPLATPCQDIFAGDRTRPRKGAVSPGLSDVATTRSGQRRPMPDMSAFENTRGDRSTDDSTTVDSQGAASALKLTCPPTPSRTPAWATENGAHTFLGRQNSLIATKVLLSVPTQVLEGRCSLENSVLDDDSKQNSYSKGFGRVSGVKPDGDSNDDQAMNIDAMEDGDLPSSPVQDGPKSVTIPYTVVKTPKVQGPPKVNRRVPLESDANTVVSLATDFEILRKLGSGAFADVFKVRSRRDNNLYAVKRNRRQFRGKRDRDMALTEVQVMQRLQSVCAEKTSSSPASVERNSYCLYLLFFYRAWQEDGYFLCQTELCCRDTCQELLGSLRFLGNSSKSKYPSLLRNLPIRDGSQTGIINPHPQVPTETVWKICHDVVAGLCHIHAHGLVHHDIKPSNIFLTSHPRFGAMCKIGDFGMAGERGSSAEGLEGDTRYIAPELLSSGTRDPRADIFSFGLTLFELASEHLEELPTEGQGWHDLRRANGTELPAGRGSDLVKLVKAMTDPNAANRPSAKSILQLRDVSLAGSRCNHFLRDYIHDVDEYDRLEEERLAMESNEGQTPRNGSNRGFGAVRSPSLSMIIPSVPSILSPVGPTGDKRRPDFLHAS
eukprot:Nitzschia sp. Nitz4//scaffold41_size133979//10262//13661//NITZ4_003327-RA/size133979-snap-gene-0.115-mRNA-1//-1//CDS//3329551410//5218//frame0